MKTGAELITEERLRQIDKESYSASQDDLYVKDQMVEAAIAYCLHDDLWWPWDLKAFKLAAEARDEESPGRIRDLVKAGALIAAEIDRLQRKLAREAMNTAFESAWDGTDEPTHILTPYETLVITEGRARIFKVDSDLNEAEVTGEEFERVLSQIKKFLETGGKTT